MVKIPFSNVIGIESSMINVLLDEFEINALVDSGST